MIKSRYDRNREWTPAQKAEGVKLAALITAAANDLTKVEVQLEKMGYAQDSTGNWWHHGELVPSPPAGKPDGIGIMPFVSGR